MNRLSQAPKRSLAYRTSTFLNCQVEHIEIAGMLGLGVFDDKKIDLRQVNV